MKPEPNLDHGLLLAAIRTAYNIPARQLCFVPKGFVTNGYIVECDHATNGKPERYFLKVWSPSRWGNISAGRLGFTIPLIERLAELGLPVPQAVRTLTGAWKATLGSLTMVMFEYIDGHTLDEEDPSPEVTSELAGWLAHLHHISPQIGLDIPLVENFQAWFGNTLLQGLDNLEAVSTQHRPGQQALKQILLPEKNRILTYYQRMLELGEVARSFQSEFVLCHTDLNGSNVIRRTGANNSRLCLLDWEGAMLAPREHDLVLFTGPNFPLFLQAYRQAAGPVDLHAETFGFYFYRRNLEDLTDWIVTILHENNTDSQDAGDLAGIQADVVAGWSYLEPGLQCVAQQLGA